MKSSKNWGGYLLLPGLIAIAAVSYNLTSWGEVGWLMLVGKIFVAIFATLILLAILDPDGILLWVMLYLYPYGGFISSFFLVGIAYGIANEMPILTIILQSVGMAAAMFLALSLFFLIGWAIAWWGPELMVWAKKCLGRRVI
ncbi:MAG TPA: hypothetical protein P5267_03335 [Patescibacteria group bacterium]|nr:hypothetical protein [Patescibacteria group bacterium]